jgi:hypothetical protein
MSVCVYAMFEELLLISNDIEEALSACNPGEPLAVTDCIEEVRHDMLRIERKLRAYEREEVARDDDG